MKVRLTREPLLAALQSASAVVPARSPKPVLSNVKLEAHGTSAVLSATDLEVGIRIELEAVESGAAGAVLLPSGRLMAIVRESQPGTVFDIHSDGTAAIVTPPPPPPQADTTTDASPVAMHTWSASASPYHRHLRAPSHGSAGGGGGAVPRLRHLHLRQRRRHADRITLER
jgi:hypothetical protein